MKGGGWCFVLFFKAARVGAGEGSGTHQRYGFHRTLTHKCDAAGWGGGKKKPTSAPKRFTTGALKRHTTDTQHNSRTTGRAECVCGEVHKCK